MRARDLAAPACLALAGAFLLAVLGLQTMAFTDYEAEAEPALLALRHGHLWAFLHHLPAYGGSLILRAPFALLPAAWHGGDLALFRTMAAPCLLAAVALAVVLHRRALGARRRAHRGAGRRSCSWPPTRSRCAPWRSVIPRSSSAARCASAPGSPRSPAARCWPARCSAPRWPTSRGPSSRSPRSCSCSATGADAPWPARWASPPCSSPRCSCSAAGALTSTVATARTSGAIFQPWQLWWFLGEHGHRVMGLYGAHDGYRTPAPWITRISHPLVILVPVAVALLVGRRRRVAGARAGARPPGPRAAAARPARHLEHGLLRAARRAWRWSAWEVHARRPPHGGAVRHGAELGLLRAAARRGQPRSAGRLLPGMERAAGLRARAGRSCAPRTGAPTR